jgi:predicted ATPase
MTVICGFKIGNFKAFSETQYVPIRPLTLIFGANSSGKSSLIHGLVLGHEAIHSGELDIHRTDIGGDSVDLGGFRQYVHRRDAELQVEWALEIVRDGFTERLKELMYKVEKVTFGLSLGLGKFARSLLEDIGQLTLRDLYEFLIEEAREKGDFELVKKYESERKGRTDYITFQELSRIEGDVHVETCWIDLGEKRLLSMSQRSEGHLQLDVLKHEHEMVQYIVNSIIQAMTTAEKTTELDQTVISETINELVPRLSFTVEHFFPKKLMKDKSQIDLTAQSAIFAISKERRGEDLRKAIEYYLPRVLQEIILGLTDVINKEMERLIYLGPLRSYPPRHLAFSEYHDPNWQAGGGSAWDVVRRDMEIRSHVNKWLGDAEKLSTPYELGARNLLTIEDIKAKHSDLVGKTVLEVREELSNGMSMDPFDELEERIENIPEKLKEFEPLLSEIQELVLIDKRSNTLVSHRDVGIGVSQVLPVLVTAYASVNKIIAIEQPEIHLHPALQAELGDVFIESALGGNRNIFIIESHSEHILLRLMRRIRETSTQKLPNGVLPVRPEDVTVLFVEPDGSRSIIHEMPIDEKGDLVKPWPGGFFEEDFKELF